MFLSGISVVFAGELALAGLLVGAGAAFAGLPAFDGAAAVGSIFGNADAGAFGSLEEEVDGAGGCKIGSSGAIGLSFGAAWLDVPGSLRCRGGDLLSSVLSIFRQLVGTVDGVQCGRCGCDGTEVGAAVDVLGAG